MTTLLSGRDTGHPNYDRQDGFRHHDANAAARFADTGGWYFNLARDGVARAGLTRERAKQIRFEACHENGATRDRVFSDPRR